MERLSCSKNLTRSGNVSGSRQAGMIKFRCYSIHIIWLCIMKEEKQGKHSKNDLLVTKLPLESKQYETSCSNNQSVLHNSFMRHTLVHIGLGQLNRYSDSLPTGRSGDRIPVGAIFSAPVKTGPGAHPAYYIMGTGSFLGVKRLGHGVDPNNNTHHSA